jgi:uncharacterized protein (TIGR02145 family)
MKTIRFTAFSILFGLLVLVSACKKETKPTAAATQTGSKIMVTGQDAGAGLKSTIIGQTTVWVAGDRVGIYSADARTTSGGAIAIVNAPFTAGSNAASSTFSGTMYWGAAAPTPHTFYAYYPYKEGSAASTAVPISLPDVQTQSGAGNSDHIGALDFLVATPVTVNSPGIDQISNTAVHLSYNHLFTVLEFQIKGSGPLKAVKLVGTSNPVAFSGGTIDLNQTPTAAPYAFVSQTGTTTQAVVTLTTQATLNTSTATSIYMVINPGTQTGNCLVGLYDGTTWTYISRAAPSGGFLRGMKYVVTIDQASAASLVDQDGNNFGIVTIGNQTWMAENLKTTKYNDGTAITNVTVNETWATLGTEAYCWYGNDIANKAIYGALYNWYAVNTGKLCPAGWHVPSKAEWTTLINNLGGSSYAGGALKETGTTHWKPSNTGATNEVGFTALPGGYRGYNDGLFYSNGNSGFWWSSSSSYEWPGQALYQGMYYINSYVEDDDDLQTLGLSVRCLRN